MTSQLTMRARPFILAVISVLSMTVFAGCASESEASHVMPTTATPTSAPRSVSPPDADSLRNVPPQPDVLIIGDSFTEGYGASSSTASWATIAAESLQWRATIDGIGGTGFTKAVASDGRDDLDFRRRLDTHAAGGADYDLVVLQGGLNDSEVDPSVEVANVRAVVRASRLAWPNAPIIVFGPSSPPASVDYRRNAAAIKSAAIDAGAIFIDPGEPRPWISALNAHRFDSGDGLHLNDAGYVYLAARFVAAIEALAD